jgi:hypothetical protein
MLTLVSLLPAETLAGVTQLMTGTGATVSVWELEMTPSKLFTMTVAVPVRRSPVGTVTVQTVAVHEGVGV